MIQVAIMGYGTIGSGVAEILTKNAEQIKNGCGQDVALKYVLDLRDFPGSPVEDKIVHDFSVIEQDPEVSVVVETMGGLNPSYPFVKASLLAGKHVVTSNKALVAAYGTELLAIARAAVAKPPVLILDEATSSVDTRTERLIENGMDAIMEGRTVFVIAHRLSTVRNSKAIMVLEKGQIIERGSHDELIEQKGRYYQLYTGQFELE